MKKVIKLLPIFVLSSALISSPSTKVNFYEEARDPFLTSEIKKANIETSSENEVFPTISQHGYDENGNQYLRFLTPFSLKSSSVKLEYTRTYETSIVKKEVSTVYESVNLQGKLNYWNGTEFSNVKGEKTYYIASYTIKFDLSLENYDASALDYKITASLSLIDGENKIESTAKTTSLNDNRSDVTLNIVESGNGRISTSKDSYKVGDIIELTTFAKEGTYLSSLTYNGTELENLSNLKFIANSSEMNLVATFQDGYLAKNFKNDGAISANYNNGNKSYNVAKENDGYHISFDSTSTEGNLSWDSVLLEFDKDNADFNYLSVAFEVKSDVTLTEIGVEIGADNESNKYQTFVGIDGRKEKGLIRKNFNLSSYADKLSSTWGNVALRFDRTPNAGHVEIVIKSVSLMKSTFINDDTLNSSFESNSTYNTYNDFDVTIHEYGQILSFIDKKNNWDSFILNFDNSVTYSSIRFEVTCNIPLGTTLPIYMKNNDYGQTEEFNNDGLNQGWFTLKDGWNGFTFDTPNDTSKSLGQLIIQPSYGDGVGYKEIIVHKITFVK